MADLISAIITNDLENARYLLNLGAGVNETDENGETPFFHAVYHDNLDMQKLLVEFKANVNVSNHRDLTPLMWASTRGHSYTASYLLRVGADINAQDKEGWSPLYWAVRSGKLDTARLLLISGADINTQDDDGTTPIIWSSKMGELKMTQLLLEFGADISITDVFDKTPLDWVKDSLKKDIKYVKISSCLTAYQDRLKGLETLKEYLNLGVWINNDLDLFYLLPKQFQDQANILVQIYSQSMNDLPLEIFHELLIDLWGLFSYNFSENLFYTISTGRNLFSENRNFAKLYDTILTCENVE